MKTSAGPTGVVFENRSVGYALVFILYVISQSNRVMRPWILQLCFVFTATGLPWEDRTKEIIWTLQLRSLLIRGIMQRFLGKLADSPRYPCRTTCVSGERFTFGKSRILCVSFGKTTSYLLQYLLE